MAYQYRYIVDTNGVVVSPVISFDGPLSVAAGATPGQYNVISDNASTYPHPYLGSSADNSAYMYYNGTSYYYLTNTHYPQGAATFDPDDRRLTPYVACFLTGTMIATPEGERAVESLTIGEMVLTADGRTVAVKWSGRQTVAALFARDERAPVKVSAGAFGDGLPIRDLKLTCDHALLIDGALVQAGALVNGTTIRRMTPEETGAVYTVWHVETEAHELILAEGCAAETFIDNDSRGRFDNHAEYVALYGDTPGAVEMDLPRVKSARQRRAA